uniref:peptidylprolyl isomerase n=1 Tax=Gouania willdenowi TaxID=441366 RepID=A0A8C5E1Q8_GOUWI
MPEKNSTSKNIKGRPQRAEFQKMTSQTNNGNLLIICFLVFQVVYQSSDSASVMKSGKNIVMDQFMRRETDPQPPADEWLDIFRNGVLLKKVLQAGRGRYSRPHVGQIVKIHLTTRLLDGTLFNEDPELSFTVGDWKVNRGVDEAVQLMGMGEKALFKVWSAIEFEITLLMLQT